MKIQKNTSFASKLKKCLIYWITKNHPCPDGEIFDDPDGWKLRVWIPGQIHKRTYLSNFTYDTRKDAEDSMDWFIKIGKNKSDFKD